MQFMNAIACCVLLASCGVERRTFDGAHGSVEGRSDVTEVVAAVKATNELYADPTFWKLVENRMWVGQDDASVAMTGTDVRGYLATIKPEEQVYSVGHVFAKSWLFGIRRLVHVSYGKTNTCEASDADEGAGRCGHVFVDVYHLPRGAGEPSIVNTIAHEVTHTIGSGSVGMCGCSNKATRFTDTGARRQPEGVEAWLVSYGIGDLAQCYAENKPDLVKVDDCFYGHLNGGDCNRLLVMCCRNDADTPATVAARAATARCAAIAPLCPAPSEVRCSYELK